MRGRRGPAGLGLALGLLAALTGASAAASGGERETFAVHAGLERGALRWLPGSFATPEDRALPGLGAGVVAGRAGRWEVAVEVFHLEATSRSEGGVARGRMVEKAQGAAFSPRLVAGGWALGPRVGYVEVEVERDGDPLAPRVRSYLRTAELSVGRDLAHGRWTHLRATAGLGVALGRAVTPSPRLRHDWSGPVLRLALHAGLSGSALAGTRQAPLENSTRKYLSMNAR